MVQKIERILIIEDDAIQSMMIKQLFKQYDNRYETTMVGSIADAKQILLNSNFDVIISDHHLPDGKSGDIIPFANNIPVVIMTANHDIDLALDMMKKDQVYDFVVKDYGKEFINHLSKVIDRALEIKRMEMKYENQRIQYMELVENVHEIICKTDNTGHITFVNEQIRPILNYDPEQLIGKHYSKLVTIKDQLKILRFYHTLVKQNEKVGYIEFRAIDGLGQERWVGQTTKLKFDDKNGLSGFLLVTRDISNQKKAEIKIHDQNKLLKDQNEEIKKNYEELLRARVSRKALTIVLTFAVVLFILSEAFIEPFIETIAPYQWVSLTLKGFIALLLKPIDSVVESYLIKRQLKSRNQVIK